MRCLGPRDRSDGRGGMGAAEEVPLGPPSGPGWRCTRWAAGHVLSLRASATNAEAVVRSGSACGAGQRGRWRAKTRWLLRRWGGGRPDEIAHAVRSLPALVPRITDASTFADGGYTFPGERRLVGG